MDIVDTVIAIYRKQFSEFAFAASAAERGTQEMILAGTWRLSVVVKGEVGHRPLPLDVAHGTEAEMHRTAETWNERLGLTKKEVSEIIMSSFGEADKPVRIDLDTIDGRHRGFIPTRIREARLGPQTAQSETRLTGDALNAVRNYKGR